MSERDAADGSSSAREYPTPDELANWNCTRCEYNLAGLSVSGDCPECGLAIEKSRYGHLLRFNIETFANWWSITRAVLTRPSSFYGQIVHPAVYAAAYLRWNCWIHWGIMACALSLNWILDEVFLSRNPKAFDDLVRFLLGSTVGLGFVCYAFTICSYYTFILAFKLLAFVLMRQTDQPAARTIASSLLYCTAPLTIIGGVCGLLIFPGYPLLCSVLGSPGHLMLMLLVLGIVEVLGLAWCVSIFHRCLRGIERAPLEAQRFEQIP